MKKRKRSTVIKVQHRDSLFRGIFKILKHFIALLKHCNPGRCDLTEDDIMLFDLDSSITERIRRNDVSFITKDNRLIILIEHQSTIGANIAFRLFLYYIELLQLWIKINNVNLYGKRKLPDFPLPEFYVAYNGNEPLKETQSTFNLEYTGIKIDIQVNIIDIRFDQLADQTPENALAGYSYFYKVYEEQMKTGANTEEAFTKARETCMEQDYLKGFIDKEGFILFYKDFLNYDAQLFEEGREEGREEGLLVSALKFLQSGTSLADVIRVLGLSDNQVEELKKHFA